MKYFLLFPLFTAGCATAGVSGQETSFSLEAKLINMERSSWIAWEKHDSRFWETFLSEDHVEVHANGVGDRKQVLAVVRSGACLVSEYSLDRFTFRQFDPDTALLVYRAGQSTKCGNSPVPSPVWATSLYKKRGGRWRNVLYVHTPIRD